MTSYFTTTATTDSAPRCEGCGARRRPVRIGRVVQTCLHTIDCPVAIELQAKG